MRGNTLRGLKKQLGTGFSMSNWVDKALDKEYRYINLEDIDQRIDQMKEYIFALNNHDEDETDKENYLNKVITFTTNSTK